MAKTDSTQTPIEPLPEVVIGNPDTPVTLGNIIASINSSKEGISILPDRFLVFTGTLSNAAGGLKGKIITTTGSSIDGTYIMNSSITGNQIASATITATNIANATITANQIANATITAGQIANATITGNQISTTAGIVGSQLQNNTISATQITNATITATQVANGAITPIKTTLPLFVVSAGTFTNNSPTSTKVAWSGIKITYNGTENSITNGNTASTYITWDSSSPTVLAGSATVPTTNTVFLLGINNLGTYSSIWDMPQVNGAQIQNNTITATQIQNATITGTQIASATIASGNIANATIIGTNISLTAGITGGQLSSTAGIVGSQIANTTITGANISNNTVTIGKCSIPTHFITATWTDNSPTATKVAWASTTVDYAGTTYLITSGNTDKKYIWWDLSLSTTTFQVTDTLPTLVDGDCLVAENNSGVHRLIWNATDVSGSQIQLAAITGANIANSTITGGNLVNNTITATQISNATITGTCIANTTIAGGNLVNNTITATQIENGTITATQIANATITATQIANNTITASQIANSTITASQIANLTITAAQIDNLTISNGKINDVGVSKLTAGTISAGSYIATAGAGYQRVVISPSGLIAYDASDRYVGEVNGAGFASPAILVGQPYDDIHALTLISQHTTGVQSASYIITKGYQSPVHFQIDNANNPNPTINIVNNGLGKDISGNNSTWDVTKIGIGTFDSLYVTNSAVTISSYPETTNDGGYTLNSFNSGYYEGTGQSFATDSVGYKLSSAKFYLKKSGTPTGTAVAKLWSHTGTYGTSSVPLNPPTFTNIDTYSESNQDSSYDLYTGSDIKAAQSFSNLGTNTLNDVIFYLRKTGSPTGTLVATIYTHSGTFGTDSVPTGVALATSDPIDVSLLTTGYILNAFHFTGANQISLTANYYCVAIEFTSTSSNSSNYVMVGKDSSAPSAGGNSSHYAGSWTAVNGADVCFYVQKRTEGTGLLVTSATLDVSTLTTDYALKTFTFSGTNQYAMTANTNYVITIEYTSGDATNYVLVGYDSSSPTATGNACTLTAEVPTAVSGTDLNFYVYGYPKIIARVPNWIIASDNLQISADTERSRSTSSYASAKEIIVKAHGTIRVKYDYKSSANDGTVYARLYKNGVALGAERSISSTTYATSSEDFSFVANDLVQVCIKGDGGRSAYVKNFRLYYDESIITTFTTVNTD